MASANLDSDEKRREFKLNGKSLTDGLKRGTIDISSIFNRFTAMNFLELSESPLLTALPKDVARLSSLTNLALQGNQLQQLPNEIGELKKLKYLDISRNLLTELPSTIGGCSSLETLNAANNRLCGVPDTLSGCERLAHFDGSHNLFEIFPRPLVDKKLHHLAEILLKSNQIGDIPIEISNLTSLKTLDLVENKIRVVPGELGDCSKLKELRLAGNELADRRLRKLIDDNVQKPILDYVRKNCPKTKIEKSTKSKKRNDSSQDNATASVNDETNEIEEIDQCKDKIIVSPSRWEISIEFQKDVSEIRPYVLFCIVKDIDISDPKSLKEFLSMQTKLHDTACHRRVAATIATHDLSKIEFPIVYTAKAPETITIHQLGRSKECSAVELVTQLNAEAEQLRKEKKRQVYSGVHQYLYLLKDKPKYACLTDAQNRVVSLPPITNSDLTKISSTTKDLLLEVTSDKDAATCKRVMEDLLKGIFTSVLIKTIDRSDGTRYKSMYIEQVKVKNEDGTLKVAYPSKNDLNEFGDNIEIMREWIKNEEQ